MGGFRAYRKGSKCIQNRCHVKLATFVFDDTCNLDTFLYTKMLNTIDIDMIINTMYWESHM